MSSESAPQPVPVGSALCFHSRERLASSPGIPGRERCSRFVFSGDTFLLHLSSNFILELGLFLPADFPKYCSFPILISPIKLEGPDDCCCSVTKSCPTLYDPMVCSMPGLPIPHHLPKFAQVHGHRIGDAVQPSHHLSPSSPSAFNGARYLPHFKMVCTWHRGKARLRTHFDFKSWHLTHPLCCPVLISLPTPSL